MQLVSSAENSSLDWRAQYTYLEDIGDGRGYTGGIIGFCSGTGDLLEVVRELHEAAAATTRCAGSCPALREVNGTDSHAGLGPTVRARLARGRRSSAAFRRRPGRRARPDLLRPRGAPRPGRRHAHARAVRLLRRPT